MESSGVEEGYQESQSASEENKSEESKLKENEASFIFNLILIPIKCK